MCLPPSIFLTILLQPVGTPLDKGRGDVPLYSAGHTKHEWTSWAAMEWIFADMDQAMKEGNSEGNKAMGEDNTEGNQAMEEGNTEGNSEETDKREEL